MKSCITAILCVFIYQPIEAQNQMEIDGSIIIESNGSTPPVEGMMRWNTSMDMFEGYNGSKWIQFGDASSIWGQKSGINENSSFTFVGANANAHLGTGIAYENGALLIGASGVSGDEEKMILHTKNGFGEWENISSICPLTKYHPPSQAFLGYQIKSDHGVFITSAYGNQKVIISSACVIDTVISIPPSAGSIEFGSSVDIVGDFAFVGAPQYNSQRGAVFIYHHDGTNWSIYDTLHIGGGIQDDRFGHYIAVKGNLLLVSGPNFGTSNGFVNVYSYNIGSDWSLDQRINVPADHEGFGSSIAIGEGYVVITYRQTSTINGKIHLYKKGLSTWNLSQTIESYKNDNTFGFHISISDKYLRTGSLNTNGGDGEAYLYTYDGDQLNFQTTMNPASGQSRSFGDIVLISGDEIFISASNEDINGNAQQGRNYYFTKN